MTAAQNGQTEVVEQLMMGRADPNGEADHGFRPLHRAAAAGSSIYWHSNLVTSSDWLRMLVPKRSNCIYHIQTL
jgi:ankyrin repeat protein